jgi:hypothetical protein
MRAPDIEALTESIRQEHIGKIDGAALLNEITGFIRRYVALSEAQVNTVALWILHTHTYEASDATPYLAINSAEKQCGKTRLLEVLELLVANPWLTGRTSAAALVRKVEANGPTLLLDESDAAFKGPEEYSEALRGILNSGHRAGGRVSLCVGQGSKIEVKDFCTYCPKAIAGIGNLPDTIADRSIPIRLKRRAPFEKVSRFRNRTAPREASPIRTRIQAWAELHGEILRKAEAPELPDSLSDRQQDASEPLVIISDLIGGLWPQLTRRSLLEVFNSGRASNESVGARLLADIEAVFLSRHNDRISSEDLCNTLAADKASPWAEWSNGKPITQNKLARLLSPYGIKPHTVRFGEETAKGYEDGDFSDSWVRYLQTVTTSQPAPDAASEHFSERNTQNHVTPLNVQKPASNGHCDAVTVSGPDIAQRDPGED